MLVKFHRHSEKKYTVVTNLYLTLSCGSNLVLDGQHQFGLSGQVLAAPLLVLQRYRDASRQVVHAADDGQVSIRLWTSVIKEEF